MNAAAKSSLLRLSRRLLRPCSDGQSLEVLTSHLVESGNPYTALLYAHLAELGVRSRRYSHAKFFQQHADIIHIHWPEYFFGYSRRPLLVRLKQQLLQLKRQLGSRVIWTVHELYPHDENERKASRAFHDPFLELIDGCITLTEGSQQLVEETFPQLRDRPMFVIPHGHYRSVVPNRLSKAEARLRLGLKPDQQVVSFFGNIKPYKGLPELLHTFHKLKGSQLRLLIAGGCEDPQLAQQLRRQADADRRVRCQLEFIPEEDIQCWINPADLMVLPYQSIHNSGSVFLALSLNRPVLAPRLGALEELQAQIGSDWLRLYDGPLTPKVLAGGLEWSRTLVRAAAAPLDQFGWDRIAGKTLDAYYGTLRAR